MSLISTKNLIAPLANKLHMIAIVLLTVGFVALRLSGGAVRVSSVTDLRGEKQAGSGGVSLDEYIPDLRMERGGNSAVKPENQTGHLNQVVSGIKAPWEEKKAAPAPPPAVAARDEQPAKKKGGLDDIEKALGMK